MMQGSQSSGDVYEPSPSLTTPEALEADLDVAPEASLPEADSPHVPPAPCEDSWHQ